eukprot:552_1
MQTRNKLLVSSKRELIKICKQNKINTKGCLAKMDYVGKILQHQQKQQNKKKKKANKNKKKKKKENKMTENKKEAVAVKKRVRIDWDNIDENKTAESDSDSEYSSDSLELDYPEYIPARVSLTKIFNINIYNNMYKEENKNKNKKRESIESNVSILSSIDSFEDQMSIPKFIPSNSMHTILDNEDENNQEFKQNNIENELNNKDPFKRIDIALYQYYKYFDRMDYFNENKQGKFTKFCMDKKLLNKQLIKEQFEDNEDPTKCPYLTFDDNFPLILTKEIKSNNNDKIQKENELKLVEIYNVIEYCYHHGQSPYF